MTSRNEPQIVNENQAMQEILRWSTDRPNWQRDALRRLVEFGELDESDIDTLTDICKEQQAVFQPLSADHISSQPVGSDTVAIQTVHNVQNVNALVPEQRLGFIPKGLTVVYGDNGAGKSGYVRILKSACRARTQNGREEPILSNIYENNDHPQSAQLNYIVGEQDKNTQWKKDTLTDDILTEVSVFDSKTANVHVEATNDLAYTPYPMKLLEKLAKACTSIKTKIDGEISAIKAQTPEVISNPNCTNTTNVGKLMTSLSKDTNVESINSFCDLSEAEIARLTQLTSDFSENPASKARQLRARKTRLNDLLTKLKVLEVAISDENLTKLCDLSTDFQSKKNAAEIASQNLFDDEPLEGVGSDTWRTLWEAARAFSTSEAYKDTPFPKTDEDARCVLCQQELDEESSQRLQSFESFVQDQIQTAVDEAKKLLKNHRNLLSRAITPQSQLLKDWLFISDELGSVELSSRIRKFAVLALWRLRGALRSNGNKIHTLPDLAATGLSGEIDSLETRANTLLTDDQSDERRQLRAEYDELKDRQWLSGIQQDLIAEVNRLKKIDKLETANKDTRPNSITTKNTSLSQALVTERLRTRFAQEIDQLNLAELAVELSQQQSRQGISRFRISLIRNSNENAGDILSEGEYRCVALAGFLAELTTNNSSSGIIFDDPVSSLDHLHREAIAKRLAQEAKNRQIIVFTHDLPFLFLLRNACTQGSNLDDMTDIALRHIQKRDGKPGFCRNEAPDKALDAQSRIDKLSTHLTNTRIKHETDPDSMDWLITARGLIDSLRQTWETAVEDAISPVLRTFSSKVNTKGFAKLSAITEADANEMRSHYGTLSELLHKTSDDINPSAPSPDKIEEELHSLDQWIQSVSQRQNLINQM